MKTKKMTMTTTWRKRKRRKNCPELEECQLKNLHLKTIERVVKAVKMIDVGITDQNQLEREGINLKLAITKKVKAHHMKMISPTRALKNRRLLKRKI